MNKILIGFVLLLIGNFCFPQQNLKITGRIPQPDSDKFYRIQLGSFKVPRNAELTFSRLKNAGFDPVYENYRDFTRVLLTGLNARNTSMILKTIELIGFKEVWIMEDDPPAGFLVEPDDYIYGTPETGALEDFYAVEEENTAFEPYPEEEAENIIEEAENIMVEAKNIIVDPNYYTVMIGESKNIRLDTLVNSLGVVWSSRNPEIAAVDDSGIITGLSTGSTVIEADYAETTIDVSVTVVPASRIHYVPKDQETFVQADENTLMTPGTIGLAAYKTEPTARLAYRFVNPGDNRGASGINGGIDVLGKGKNDRWMWTTYYQGGFFYDLNGVQHIMTGGVQRDRNGVVLTVEPSFVYIDGVSYLELKHTLKNNGRTAVSGQKFGAGADIMIHNNDHASVAVKDFGLVMTDALDENISSLNLMFVGKTGQEILPVDTLWIGRWERGEYLKHIYDDGADAQYYDGADSAMTFSFQNIGLLPDESKEYIIRFTLARSSN